MSDQELLSVPQVEAAPVDYAVPNAQEIALQTVTATFDGSGAAAEFLPALQIIGPGGIVAGTFVDPSTPVAAGGSAEVTFGSFLGRASNSAAAASALTLLKTVTLAGAGNIDWGNGFNGTIPQTYRDIVCVVTARLTAAVAVGSCDVTLNADTGSKYGNDFLAVNNGVVSGGRAAYPTAGGIGIGDLPGASSGAIEWGRSELIFPGYADLSINKLVLFRTNAWYDSGGTSDEHDYVGSVLYQVTDAITRITIGGPLQAGSRADFYGRGTQ